MTSYFALTNDITSSSKSRTAVQVATGLSLGWWAYYYYYYYRVRQQQQRWVVQVDDDDDGVVTCDYLVVGAGTAGMSFVDTILSEKPSATVVLVDRHARPGGHWNRAYPFVRLHQPSCFYGVNSLALGKKTTRWGTEAFDVDDMATAPEIVAYYERVIRSWNESYGNRVRCLFDAEYQGKASSSSEGKTTTHIIVSNGTVVTRVRCVERLVTVASNVVVPSMRKEPLFPITAHGVHLIPVNGLTDAVGSYDKYVVIGAGKTGCDAVLELLRRGIDQARIQWVVSRDVWYFVRNVMYENNNSFADTARFMRLFLEGISVRDTFLALERMGFVARLDPDGPFPEVCKAPIVTKQEVALLRSVRDVVRSGRIVSITADEVTLERGTLSLSCAARTVFVDCMAEDFYGYGSFNEEFRLFEPGRINLGPLFVVNNASFSSALVAYAESAFARDDVKNDVFFLLTGRHNLGTPQTLLGGFYAQLKTFKALVNLRPSAGLFLLGSRTNSDSLNNRGGSLLKFMWGLYGPLRLDKKGDEFVKKIDDGGFSDIDHCFGVGRPLPTKASFK